MSRPARPPRGQAEFGPSGDAPEQTLEPKNFGRSGDAAEQTPAPDFGPSGDVPKQTPDPDFGPSGYLPAKAARRARKIVLRAPLGLQWVLAALAAGVILLLVGLVFVAGAGRPPDAPYVAVGPVEAIGDARYDDERRVLFVAAAGRIRAFPIPDPDDVPVYCTASGRLESAAGRVWRLTGRAIDGGRSLDQHPTMVVRGVVYLDPSTRLPGPPPHDTDAEPTCF